MKIRHTKLDIPREKDSDPFLNCKLGRSKYAKVLTSLVSGYRDGFVLSIDNKWGSGKTTFVQMWQQDLENQGFTTLYFNAWENDFQEDVIIALLAELKEYEDKGEIIFKDVLTKVLPLLKKAVPEIIKFAVEKRLGESAASLLSGVGEVSVKELENSLEAFEKKKNCIVEFRDVLEEYVAKINPDKPVIFIIDELDRCRPNYAVEVLEQIKHLFSVKGIVFVLSIDKKQLGNAVKGFYGSESIDSEEYLRRFIDIEYSIPEPDKKLFCNYLFDYFDLGSFFNSTERRNSYHFNDDDATFKTISEIIFTEKGLILRQIEKIYSHTAIVLKTFPSNRYVFPVSLFFLIYCKSHHKDIFEQIKNKLYSIQDLVIEIEKILPNSSIKENNRYLSYLMSNLLCLYSNYIKNNSVNSMLLRKIENSDDYELTVEFKRTEPDYKTDILANTKAFFAKWEQRDESIETMLKKITLSDAFVV